LYRPLDAPCCRAAFNFAAKVVVFSRCQPVTTKIKGVNVCGFIDGEFGLGEAVRSTIRALESQSIPTAVNNLNAELIHRRNDESIAVTGNENPFPINIIQVNGNWLPEFKTQFRDEYLRGRYNFAYWAWE
jgi:hypothetical protein